MENTKDTQKVEGNKSPSPNDKKKDKKKKAKIIAIILGIVLGIIIIVIILLLVRNCQNKKEEYYTVKVIQPTKEYSNWKLTVNGQEGTLKVKYMTQLDVVIEQRESTVNNYSIFDQTQTNAWNYYILVSDEATGAKTWTSSQMYLKDGKYHTSFKMQWNYNIVVQAQASEDFEGFIYTIDEGSAEHDVLYTYDATLFESWSDIYRINVTTQALEIVKRDQFNDNLVIGNKIKSLDSYFLSGCTNFDSHIYFQENLLTISDCFLYECKKFNQPIVFPNSLTEIRGNFMSYCEEFNQPIDTKNIIYLYRADQSSFLNGCKKFNSKITIGSALVQIPNNFLMDCTSFNQDITIPSTIKRIGDAFMFNCDSMTSTITVECPDTALIASYHTCSTLNQNAPCFETGIKIDGSSKTAFINTFYPLYGADPEYCYRRLKSA